MNTHRVALAALAMSMALAGPAAAQKTPVAGIADLPRFSYPYQGDVGALMTNPAALDPLAAKARADVEATLAGYDITDRSTLRGLHGALASIALWQHDYLTVEREVAAQRALADKPIDKATAGDLALTVIAAVRSGAKPGSPAYAAAFRKAYGDGMNALPWSLYGDRAIENVGQDAVFSGPVIVSLTRNHVQSEVTKGGRISEQSMRQLIRYAATLRDFIPLKHEMLTVDREYLASHQVAKPDIWAARDVVLSSADKTSPVVVAIWDGGFDVNLFPGRVWTNPREQVNGRDDDGDSWVDDVHGVSVNENGVRETSILMPTPPGLAPRLARVVDLEIGRSDQFANRDTPAARAFVAFIDGGDAKTIDQYFADGEYFRNWMHGTHVAGIVANGNPALRLMSVRRDFAWGPTPRRPTEGIARALAKSYADEIDYMKAAGVRVANLSWTVDVKSDIEDLLAANGVPEAERAAEAKRLFAIEAEALRAAIASAPDILFVCAAGNANNSASFQGSVPASFEMPNVLTVVAVGQDGVPTDFTTTGPTVDIAANGYQIESFVPGGKRMLASGTSMATPEVVNAAAKLLALDPKLTTAELRALLLDSASSGADGVKLLDTRAAVAKLRART